jgi:hypothetical protein
MSNAFPTLPQIEDTGTPVGNRANTINFLNSSVTETSPGVLEIDPTGAASGVTINNASASGAALVKNPGTGTSFNIRTIQAGRGLSIPTPNPTDDIISAATTANVALVTDVQRSSISVTGTGTPATHNLQVATLGASALSSSSTQVAFRSLLLFNIGANLGAGTVLKIVMDGSITVFTLNLDTALTASQSSYIEFGFNIFLASGTNAYLVTYVNNTPYSNQGFTRDEGTQEQTLTPFNRSILHTFQVVVDITDTTVTCTNFFSSLQNF